MDYSHKAFLLTLSCLLTACGGGGGGGGAATNDPNNPGDDNYAQTPAASAVFGSYTHDGVCGLPAGRLTFAEFSDTRPLNERSTTWSANAVLVVENDQQNTESPYFGISLGGLNQVNDEGMAIYSVGDNVQSWQDHYVSNIVWMPVLTMDEESADLTFRPNKLSFDEALFVNVQTYSSLLPQSIPQAPVMMDSNAALASNTKPTVNLLYNVGRYMEFPPMRFLHVSFNAGGDVTGIHIQCRDEETSPVTSAAGLTMAQPEADSLGINALVASYAANMATQVYSKWNDVAIHEHLALLSEVNSCSSGSTCDVLNGRPQFDHWQEYQSARIHDIGHAYTSAIMSAWDEWMINNSLNGGFIVEEVGLRLAKVHRAAAQTAIKNMLTLEFLSPLDYPTTNGDRRAVFNALPVLATESQMWHHNAIDQYLRNLH